MCWTSLLLLALAVARCQGEDNCVEIELDLSYVNLFLATVIVIVVFWFLFTAEGKNLLYVYFLKITHPGWTWAEAALEVEKKKIMNDLGHIKDSRSQVNQYSEGK